MTITAITQQVKRQDRYSIYVDGEYLFSLREQELLQLGLHTGQSVTTDQLSSYQQAAATGKWLDKLLNLLSYRLRSEWELRDYLRRKECEPVTIDTLIGRLRALGYVNDQQFAERWVENRRLLRYTSRRRLAQELQQKRIASDIITTVLEQDKDDVQEQDILRELVAKKRRRYPDDQKLMQYLARQGYGYGDIKQVLAEL